MPDPLVQLAENILAGISSGEGHIYELAHRVCSLQSPLRTLTEAEANLILEAERALFTLDYQGKEMKKRTLNALLLRLFGWSPWYGAR